MLVYCRACGHKQPPGANRCLVCSAAMGESRQIKSFERTVRTAPSISVHAQGTRLVDAYEEDEPVYPLWYRVYFAISNPWRRRWRRGPVWRAVLVLLALGTSASVVYLMYGLIVNDPVKPPSDGPLRTIFLCSEHRSRALVECPVTPPPSGGELRTLFLYSEHRSLN